jgi:hypothetical protein
VAEGPAPPLRYPSRDARGSTTIHSKKHLTKGPLNRRSLRYAAPDFLLILVALANFIRPSLRKGAYAALSSAAWQEIRVRSGRDDKGEWRFQSSAVGGRRL